MFDIFDTETIEQFGNRSKNFNPETVLALKSNIFSIKWNSPCPQDMCCVLDVIYHFNFPPFYFLVYQNTLCVHSCSVAT